MLWIVREILLFKDGVQERKGVPIERERDEK